VKARRVDSPLEDLSTIVAECEADILSQNEEWMAQFMRLVFRETVVRVEEKKEGQWRRRESFNILKDSERFIKSLG
jgi:hypothetical protein